MNSSKSDFTQGSILGKLIPFMVPILGALGASGGLRCGRPFGGRKIWNNIGTSAVSTGSQVLNLVTLSLRSFNGHYGVNCAVYR